jgi:hypothetical protein
LTQARACAHPAKRDPTPDPRISTAGPLKLCS